MVDFARLMKLRLAVARYGEMDGARWWNTQGLLGSTGAAALRRGFPRTHYFAQARLVFAVAAARCREIFDTPADATTLWDLPANVEDEFQRRLPDWQKEPGEWDRIFEAVTEQRGGLSELFAACGLTLDSPPVFTDGPGQSVELSAPSTLTDAALSDLAQGFSKGRPGELVVPFARVSA